MKTSKEIIGLFGGVRPMARTLNLSAGTVGCWVPRGIPPSRYAEIVEAADREGIELSYSDLHGHLAA